MKILIAGGGTAGHINPGLAVAKYIRRKYAGSQILFIGTGKGLETDLVPREGFELKLIRVRGFRRKLSFDTLATLKELVAGLFDARRVIRGFKPDAVVGTGGYVCGPVLFMAALMRIPTMIHEQNAFPGITNKLLSRFVGAVAVSFKESAGYFRSNRMVVLTGNPVREELISTDRAASREAAGVTGDRPLVTVTGGSRGAAPINDAVTEMLLKFYKTGDFNMIFATGGAGYADVSAKLKDFTRCGGEIKIVPYIYDAAVVYPATDIMVCRAGAITCSELSAIGIPSIMIPSPYVAENHQEYNARAMESQGASVVILERDLSGELLYRQIIDLLKDREQLHRMGRNARKNGMPDAAEKICGVLQKIMKTKR